MYKFTSLFDMKLVNGDRNEMKNKNKNKKKVFLIIVRNFYYERNLIINIFVFRVVKLPVDQIEKTNNNIIVTLLAKLRICLCNFLISIFKQNKEEKMGEKHNK